MTAETNNGKNKQQQEQATAEAVAPRATPTLATVKLPRRWGTRFHALDEGRPKAAADPLWG
jgi:hypothetical protein